MPELRYGVVKRKMITEFEQKCANIQNPNLVLIGDSIFANMEKHCPLVWDDHFCDEPRLKSPTNLGISGDKIQNVWYRIR